MRASRPASDPSLGAGRCRPRLTRNAAAVATVSLVASLLGSCGMLADDHAWSSTVGASLHRFDQSIHRTVHGLDREVRTGLHDTTALVLEVPDATVRRAGRLQRNTQGLVVGALDRASHSPIRIRDMALEFGRNERRRTASLTDTLAPSNLGAGLERSAARFHTGLRTLPSSLRLDRPLLQGPGDPANRADPIPEGRSPSLSERILRQIPW